MVQQNKIIRGSIFSQQIALPAWAQDQLHMTLWDRDEGPDCVILRSALEGPTGTFAFSADADAALKLAMLGHRTGPQHIVSVGWQSNLDPVLAHLPWPRVFSDESVTLNWDQQVSLIGYMEQIHMQEIGGLPLVVIEMAARAVPYTYRRLPPLPQSVVEDRHGLHADRSLEDCPEQIYYVLADAESSLAAVTQDALVSNLMVMCVTTLGPQEGCWHEIVNVPLLLEKITIIAP